MVVINEKEREKLFGEYLAGEMKEDRASLLLDQVRANGEIREELATLEDVGILLEAIARNEGDRQLLTDRIMAGLTDDTRQENMRRRVLAEVGAESAVRPVPRARARLQARRARRTVSWGAWIAVAACLVIVAGTILYNMRQADVGFGRLMAEVVTTSPHVYLKRGNERILCVVGVGLAPGDVLHTGASQFVTFTYTGEDTRVDVGENAEVRLKSVIGGKKLDLRAGMLDATVESQPEGMPFMVETPQAFCRVKGTVFSVGVTKDWTRLEVKKGVVELQRKSDGRSIDVAAGQYAIVGVGIDLVALPVDEKIQQPFADVKYRDGRVLFEDDFSEGVGNWIMFKQAERSEMNRRTFAGELAGATGEKAKIATVARKGSTVNVLVLDTNDGTDDQWLFARMRKPVTVKRFVVECTGSVQTPYKGGMSVDFGTLTTRFIDGTNVQYYKRSKRSVLRIGKTHVWRREYVAVPDPNGTHEVHMRFFLDGILDGWGKELSKDGSSWIDLSVENARGLVERVVIKELVPLEEEQR